MARILLVDDEPMIIDSLSYSLNREGFEVVTARDGEQALTIFKEIKPDLVILDIRLPDMNGLEVCRRLRAGSPVPIIMLTALGNELDRVVGLEVGADDYIPKPFSLRELLARVRSVLRRVELDHKAQNPNLLQVDGLQIDASSRRGFKNGTEIQLTTREFDLLFKLMSHAGQAVSREELIATVWGRDWSGDVRTLEVHVRWLRVKIEDDPTIPRFIQTVRGYGYRFIGCDEPE